MKRSCTSAYYLQHGNLNKHSLAQIYLNCFLFMQVKLNKYPAAKSPRSSMKSTTRQVMMDFTKLLPEIFVRTNWMILVVSELLLADPMLLMGKIICLIF